MKKSRYAGKVAIRWWHRRTLRGNWIWRW